MAVVTKEKPTQVLTVRLGADEFGVALNSIREIVPVQALTRVPGNPPWVKGVCNLRGTVLPVVDLGVRFGFGPIPDSKWAMFLVLELALGAQTLLVGVMVSAVNNVIPVKAADIEPTPEVGLVVQPEYVRGLVRFSERFIVLLDLHRIFASSDLVDLEAAAATAETAAAVAMTTAAVAAAAGVADTLAPPPADPGSVIGSGPPSPEQAPGTIHFFE
jgi:purine-binding chemotaxis protein CheW